MSTVLHPENVDKKIFENIREKVCETGKKAVPLHREKERNSTSASFQWTKTAQRPKEMPLAAKGNGRFEGSQAKKQLFRPASQEIFNLMNKNRKNTVTHSSSRAYLRLLRLSKLASQSLSTGKSTRKRYSIVSFVATTEKSVRGYSIDSR